MSEQPAPVQHLEIAGPSQGRIMVSAGEEYEAVDLAMLWSAYQAFGLGEEEVTAEMRRELLLDGAEIKSIEAAVDVLNAGRAASQAAPGFCIVYDESRKAYFVLFRGDSQQVAMRKFGRVQLTRAARLFASKTVASEIRSVMPLAIQFYRLMEFCANVVLLALMTWLVQPLVLLTLFLALWYVPAVLRLGAVGKPIGYPIFNFVVDDFSFLSLYPRPKNAWPMFALVVVRVVLLLALIPVCFAHLPKNVTSWLVHTEVIDLILGRVERAHGIGIAVRFVWLAVVCAVLLFSGLYLCITLHMLLIPRCCGRPSPIHGLRNDALLARVRELAEQIDAATANEDPATCRREMQRLRASRPKLKLANVVSTFGPAWAVLLHIGIDVFNIVNFAVAQDYGRAALLAFFILVTLLYAQNCTTGGLPSMWRETVTSWRRGLCTDDYLAFVRADKGIQAIPALVVTVSGLPFKMKGVKSTLGGLGSIGISIVLLVPFIYQQFDLGIECHEDTVTADSPEEAVREVAPSSGSTPMLDS